MYLKRAVRELARQHPSANVYVVTGPLYEFPMPSLPHAHLPHQVPSGYFKVIVLIEDNEISTAAFLFEQSDVRHSTFCNNSLSLEELSKHLGFQLFPSGLGENNYLLPHLGCSGL
jgi:endonuclease G